MRTFLRTWVAYGNAGASTLDCGCPVMDECDSCRGVMKDRVTYRRTYHTWFKPKNGR